MPRPPASEPTEDLPEGIDLAGISSSAHQESNGGCFIKACVLASTTLLLVGLFEKLKGGSSDRDTHRNDDHQKSSKVDSRLLSSCFAKAISAWLPLFASLTLGGERVALAMLVAFASGLPALLETRPKEWIKLLKQWRMTLCFLVAITVFDFVSVGWFLHGGNPHAGYLALFLSVFLIRPPFRNLAQPAIKGISSVAASKSSGSTIEFVPKSAIPGHEITANLLSGATLSIFTIMVTVLFGEMSVTISNIFTITLVAFFSAASLVLSFPVTLSSSSSIKIGLASGLAFSIISTSVSLRQWSWPLAVELCFGTLGYFAAYTDGNRGIALLHNNRNPHHADGDRKASRISLYLIQSCEQYALLNSILREKDSRRIFYFMTFVPPPFHLVVANTPSLNFVFMLIQLSYGFTTGSLGLLSDSIHMFFDCLALVVGLCAAVMSKWPPSARFPYGYGKVDTLAGFANGIFLM